MSPLWVGFVLFVCLLLWLDLGVLNRKAHIISTAEAIRWTTLWVGIALGFSVFVYFGYTHHWSGLGRPPYGELTGLQAWHEYMAGYLTEQSLSLDNIFVIALIFAYFGVPSELQHRTLFWGIVGAMVFRGVMIGIGSELIHRYEWTLQVFGVLLLLTALKMLFTSNEEVHPDANPLVKLARRLYPVTNEFCGQQFFVRLEDGRRAMTPLFLVLLVIETTDIIFAVDSIPAIFGITRDPFIVFTSNVFAILGLRSLFFVLAGMMRRFTRLKYSLVVLLLVISLKMLFGWHLEAAWMLGLIVAILGAGIVASWLLPPAAEAAHEPADEAQEPPLPDA